MQFHPEVLPGSIEQWLIGHTCEIHQSPGLQVTELRQASQHYEKALHKQAQLLWHDWLTQIES